MRRSTSLRIPAAILLAAAAGLVPHGAFAQAPATLTGNPLAGTIDVHVHSGPDSFTRSVLDFEIAQIARNRKMAAIVLKNHFTSTADRAWLAERMTGQRCYGGIVLNRAVGGLNLEAVERMAACDGDRGRVVWLPTFDAEHHVRHFREDRPTIAVVRDGKPVPELGPLFAFLAKKDLVLATGHSSAEESLLLLAAAKAAGVKRMLVTHAMADPIGMTVPQMKEAAKFGAKIECVWMTNLTGPQSHLPSQRHWRRVTTADYAAAMKAVGPEHFVLASDLGQYLNPIPTDGMRAFLTELREAGFSDADLLRMSRTNAAGLLGMTD